MPYKRAEN